MPTVKPRLSHILFVVAFAALGCGSPFRPMTLPHPISMSPMSDATLSVELGHVFVTGDVMRSGMGEDSALAVVLGITNTGREPITVSAGSMSCWMELSPDLPGETRSLTPAGGGEGDFQGVDLDDLKIGSSTIPPGATRHLWVVFRGYRFAGSDAPRKITVSLPDARGRRVQIVIADPARGDLRWETAPARTGAAYGVQNTALYAPGFTTRHRRGDLAGDAGGTDHVRPRLDLGPVPREQGPDALRNIRVHGRGRERAPDAALHHVGKLAGPAPARDCTVAAASMLLAEVTGAQHDSKVAPRTYGVVSLEGGVELDVGAHGQPAASPFPVSYSRALLPRWTIRLGYTHWFIGGDNVDLNSGGVHVLVPLRLVAAREHRSSVEPERGAVRTVVAPTSSHQASKRARGVPR